MFNFIGAFITSILALFGFAHVNTAALPPVPENNVQVVQQTNIQSSTPIISSLSLDAGPAYTEVVLKGSGLGPKDTINFNGQPVTTPDYASEFVLASGDNTLTFTIPDTEGCLTNTGHICIARGLKPGRYVISVTNPQGQTSASNPSFNITATLPPSSSISVPGMSKYTDPDFGFSFWYPSGWTVVERQLTKAPDTYFPGGEVMKSYNLMDQTGTFAVSLSTVYSADSTITDTGGAGPLGSVSYWFDSNAHAWMTTKATGGLAGSPGANNAFADVSNNTMGGLHMLAGTSRFDTNIVPLSAHNFVVVIDGGSVNARLLVKTIVATDPSVATPVSAAEQIKTIQAEKDAYAGQ